LRGRVQALFGKAGRTGSPTTISERSAAYEEAVIQDLLLRFPDTEQQEELGRFAQEFIAWR